MADWRSVAKGERGVLRIFAIDLPDSDIAALTTNNSSAIRDALDVTSLDPKFVETVDLETFRTYGFARYLTEGYGIADADLAPETNRLDAFSGHVAVVVSRAFGGQAATLSVSPPLRHLATFSADKSSTPTETLHAQTAKRQTAPASAPKPRRSDAAIGGRIAVYVIIGAAALVWLMVWIAG